MRQGSLRQRQSRSPSTRQPAQSQSRASACRTRTYDSDSGRSSSAVGRRDRHKHGGGDWHDRSARVVDAGASKGRSDDRRDSWSGTVGRLHGDGHCRARVLRNSRCGCLPRRSDPWRYQRGSESRVKILTLSSDGGHDLGGSRVLHELALCGDAAGSIVLVITGVASERVVARGSLLSSKTLEWRGELTGANVPALSAVWGSPPTPAICTASARVDALLSAAALGEAGSWCWVPSCQHSVER